VIAELEPAQLHSPSLASMPEPCARPQGNALAKLNGFVVNRSDTAPTMDSAAGNRTDHALMVAVRDGELDALGELFERHHLPLFGFLVKLTGSRTTAEDITQIVFQRMLKYRHTYRDDGSFTAWMYHLARRCAADQFRRDQHAPQPADPAELYDRADDAPHAAHHATTRDDQMLLQAALAHLDHPDREVLLLSRFQEMSFAEIATILECSVGAAKVRAHRALQELRDVYFQLQKRRVGPEPRPSSES
jgi:RNA polymerase sigma factor (sigma-70 family)